MLKQKYPYQQQCFNYLILIYFQQYLFPAFDLQHFSIKKEFNIFDPSFVQVKPQYYIIITRKLTSPMNFARNTRILHQTLGLQKCPDCFSQLQSNDIIKYCPNCKKCPTLIQKNHFQPIQNFQAQYRQHLQNRPSSIIKIQSYTRDIACKLNMKLTDCQMQLIVQKVRDIHYKRGGRCKGYRQQSAAVMYRMFEDQIRMSLYQFCNKTGLNRKKFNKMYVMYLSMLRKSNIINSADPNIKFQIEYNSNQQQEPEIGGQIKKQQLQSGQQKGQSANQIAIKHVQYQNAQNHQQYGFQLQINPQKINTSLDQIFSPSKTQVQTSNLNNQQKWQEQQQKQNLRKTIAALYDKIFTSIYLQKHKTQIIKSIVEKSIQILRSYLQSQPFNCMKKYFRIPAVIFCVVKSNGYKITMKKYINEVQNILGVRITERMIAKMAALQNRKVKIQEQDDGSSPTQMQGRKRIQSDI